MPARAANLSLTGLKEIKATLSQLGAEIDGPQLYRVMGQAVEPLRRAARSNVMPLSVRVGMDVNIAANQPPSRPVKKTVMVVANKKLTMREWRAAANSRSPRAKVGTGDKVAMGLGTMFELGTTRGMKEHHWFRNAVDSTKGEVRDNMRQGLSNLIEEVIAKRKTA